MDIQYFAIGNLVAIHPLNERARAAIDALHYPNLMIRDTDGGALLARSVFADAMVLIADAGLEAVSRDEWLYDNRIDLWNAAVLAGLRGQPCPANDGYSLEGYAHGLEQSKVRVVVPARPEGYYHLPVEG